MISIGKNRRCQDVRTQTVGGETIKGERCHLLDVVALAALLLALADPATPALLAPGAMAAVDADRVAGARSERRNRLGAMDGDHVAGEVMLPAERPAARLVVTSIGLEAVGVVGLNVGLEVIRASEG